jgi:hypothetical protein
MSAIVDHMLDNHDYLTAVVIPERLTSDLIAWLHERALGVDAVVEGERLIYVVLDPDAGGV